jgi:energy-coupling factor transporter ATP-binding protein EcfA2
MSNNDIGNSFDHAERIGVIGSPSSTHSLSIDILASAVDKRLVGGLFVFKFIQDGHDHYALGQITEIRLKNVWSEDPTMRILIRHKGRVEPITERQDTHTALMFVSAVFANTKNGFEPSMLGTVPPTGTSVKLVNESIMQNLLARYRREVFYLGYVYGANILLPMWFKHFGNEEGGAGEAYHIGIFGKTGSGKSVLAKMMLLAYAKHRQLTIFVLDPQGEFAKLKDEHPMLGTLLMKKIKVYNLHNLILTSNELFKKILVMSGFLERIGIYHEDNKARAAAQIDLILRGKINGTRITKNWEQNGSKTNIKQSPNKWYRRETFDAIIEKLKEEKILLRIYGGMEYRDRVRSLLEGNHEELYDLWAKVANLFTFDGKSKIESVTIDDLIKSVTEAAKGHIIIIDLSETDVPSNILWTDEVRMLVINEFLSSLKEHAQQVFKQGKMLNTLVVIDEAHRLAPREKPDNPELERVKNTLKDAVRTTRKFGLGWMFISQTLSSLDKEIIDQIRIYIFGFGLAYGSELYALKEIIGGNEEAIRLYQTFKDPQSVLGYKEYSFMSIGPISPLSFSGAPLFFKALHYPNEFIEKNTTKR